MKNKRRIVSIVCVILVIALAFTCLASCDALAGLAGSSDTGEGNTTTKTEKIDLAKAAENFDQKDVKKTRITLKLKGTIFIQETAQGGDANLKSGYNIGTTITLDRIQDKEKMYFGASAKTSDTDVEVGGLIDGLMRSSNKLKNNYALKALGIDVAGMTDTFEGSMTSLHHYVTGQIDLNAEMGSVNGVYNLKAHYADHEKGDDGDVWLAADDESLLAWLNNTAKLEVSENMLKNYLMKTVFSTLTKENGIYGKDSAGKYLDKNGVAKYKISVKVNDLISDSLVTTLLELIGVKDKAATIQKYTEYFSDVPNWFTLTTQEVDANVKDALPQNIKTGATIDLNVDTQEVCNIIEKLRSDGIIDDMAALLSTYVVNTIQEYLCGTDGNTSTIGLRLTVDFEEKFFYKENDCKLSGDKYADYFIGIGEEVEGRYNLKDYVDGIVLDVDQFISSQLKKITENYGDQMDAIKEEIVSKVAQFISVAGKITADQVKSIIAEVLAEYEPIPDETPENGETETEEDDTKTTWDKIKDKLNELTNEE